jgi:membrane-associated HD superfamily phosphohydrolase
MLADLYDYLYHQNPTGGIPLKGTGIVVALALILAHVWALKNNARTQAFLKSFPRTFHWGVILLTIDVIWSVFALSNMDMGEFYNMRRTFIMITIGGYVAVLVYVKEFLAVRALGALMLLVAGPVLTAAFLQPQTSRLLLPILAYLWIIVGMYFIGMPFLMRDWINWLLAKPQRWNLAVYSGIAYGVVLLVTALLFY